MVKKVKAKKPAAKKGAAKTKARRPGASAKTVSKYDQPGAPWWKASLPVPKR